MWDIDPGAVRRLDDRVARLEGNLSAVNLDAWHRSFLARFAPRPSPLLGSETTEPDPPQALAGQTPGKLPVKRPREAPLVQ
jgi:hypothetical protein